MSLIFKTPADAHYFFGYYDKPATDLAVTKLLAHRVPFMDRMPTADDAAEIGYFDLTAPETGFRPVARTFAWNWQQGSMLQWVGPAFDKKILYNDRIDNRFVSVLCNIDGTDRKIFGMPVYSVTRCGKKAVCIDHEKHCWYRPGYSYTGIANEARHKPADPDDAIWVLDLETGDIKTIIRLEELMKVKPLKTMKGATHYMEHLLVSPNGRRVQFLHRWRLEDGGIHTRLFTAGMDGKNLYLLNDSGRMSHCCWQDDGHILGWGAVENPINRLRRYRFAVKYFVKPLMPVYRLLAGGDSVRGNSAVSRAVSGDSYILMKDMSNESRRVLPQHLASDGHPSFAGDSRSVFITDTYQMADGMRELKLCDMTAGTVRIIDRLQSDKTTDNSRLRCDLHPKVSHDGKYVAVDTTNDSRRSVYLYKL